MIPALIPDSSTRRCNRRRSPPTRSPNLTLTRRVAVNHRRTMTSDHSVPQRNSSSATRPSAPPSAVFRTRALVVPGVGEGAPGRRSRARNRTGTVVSSTTLVTEGHGLHVFGTLLAAAGHQRVPGRPRPTPDDVRHAVREGREGNLVIFVVDASGSMAARDRMSAVEWGCVVVVARRVPTARQGRGDHVPSGGSQVAAAADLVGAHRESSAGPLRHRRQNSAGRKVCWPRATW